MNSSDHYVQVSLLYQYHRNTTAHLIYQAAVALVLWKRPESRLNLRYVNVVSDGDSKTMKVLRKKKPYGEGVKLTKYECVGHVQKRLGKAFITRRTK